MRKKLIYLHEPDAAGNIFLPHEVDFSPEVYGAVDKFDCARLSLELVTVSGKVEFASDGIYIYMKIWDNTGGRKFAKMMEGGYHLMPIGTGRIDEQNIVRDYILHYFTLTVKPIWNVRNNLLKQHEGTSRTRLGRGIRPDN